MADESDLVDLDSLISSEVKTEQKPEPKREQETQAEQEPVQDKPIPGNFDKGLQKTQQRIAGLEKSLQDNLKVMTDSINLLFGKIDSLSESKAPRAKDDLDEIIDAEDELGVDKHAKRVAKRVKESESNLMGKVNELQATIARLNAELEETRTQQQRESLTNREERARREFNEKFPSLNYAEAKNRLNEALAEYVDDGIEYTDKQWDIIARKEWKAVISSLNAESTKKELKAPAPAKKQPDIESRAAAITSDTIKKATSDEVDMDALMDSLVS